MNIKAVAFGAVLGFLVAVAPSCGPAKCSSANCDGCCDSKGICVKKANSGNNTTCGQQGNTCDDCAAKGGTCNTTTYSCTTPVDAGPQQCDGCLIGGKTCQPLATMTATNCGIGGATCSSCAVGQSCTNGACVAVDAGQPKGRLGDACNTDNDCTKVPNSGGMPKYCKKTTFPNNNNKYPDGYCTTGCFDDTDCTNSSATGYCMGNGIPFIGELETICLKKETSASACRAGYIALPYDDTGTSFVCLPATADGTDLFVPDAGPANTGAAGIACTDNAQCGPTSPPFSCAKEALSADGGVGLNPGGVCTGDCSISAFDDTSTFCGTNGICAFDYFKQTTKAFAIYWGCGEKCMASLDGGSPASTCRTGYYCEAMYKDGTGSCKPDCTVATDTCAKALDGFSHVCNPTTRSCDFDCRKYSSVCTAPSTCDTTTGLCK